MECEKSKQKYLDKLKNTSSKGLYKSARVLDIQNDNYSVCFNETHQKYKPNDLLAKVDCYIRENPTSHITRNRLTVKRGLDQRGFVSNVQNRSNLDIVHKSSHEKDFKHVISFIKPKRTLVNYKPQTKIKFCTPDATPKIKHKQTHFDLLSQKQVLHSTAVTKTIKYEMSETIYGKFYKECFSSSKLTSSKIIRSNMQGTTSKLLDPGINKNQCIRTEEQTKLNSTYCLYMNLDHTYFEEITSTDKNIYSRNDYSVNLKKKLKKFQLKHQNQQNLENTKIIDCTDRVSYDKLKNDFNNMPSTSSSNGFIFEPFINLFESPGLSTSKLSQDSFPCSSQEILYINSDDSMNTDENKLKPHKDNFSSTEICLNENTKNTCQLKLTDNQSRLSFHTSLEKSTQKSNYTQKSSSIRSAEDSSEYYRKKKMF